MLKQDETFRQVQARLDEISREVTSPHSQMSTHRTQQVGNTEHPCTEVDRPDRLTTAKAWIHARPARDRAFGTRLFSDPAWDILLDLYVGHCEQTVVYISYLCFGSGLPLTTVLRWITTLEERGLIHRQQDEFDRRRYLISLTAQGVSRMNAALDGASDGDRKLGIERLRRTEQIDGGLYVNRRHG